MKRFPLILIVLLLAGSYVYAQKNVGGWDPDKPEKPSKAEQEEIDYSEAIQAFKKKVTGIEKFFGDAYGYALYPSVGKGALIVGGAHGNGRVYVNDKIIGTSELIQASIGFQIGGEAFREIVFFKDKNALDIFKEGKLKFSGKVSAVAATAGVSVELAYNDGVAVFTLTKGGLMADVSVGGQSFKFKAVQ